MSEISITSYSNLLHSYEKTVIITFILYIYGALYALKLELKPPSSLLMGIHGLTKYLILVILYQEQYNFITVTNPYLMYALNELSFKRIHVLM